LSLRRNATDLVVIVILFHHNDWPNAEFTAVFGGKAGSNGNSAALAINPLLSS
jgi:hypothetical protein